MPPPKPRTRPLGSSTGLPTEAVRRNHVWSWDFVSDYTQRGGKLRVFNIIDEFTRECHCIYSDRTIHSGDLLRLPREAIAQHGAPEYIRATMVPSLSLNPSSDGWLTTAFVSPKPLIVFPSGCRVARMKSEPVVNVWQIGPA